MPGDTHVMLTVLLHHDQSKTLDEIMAHLRKTGFYRDFPPEESAAPCPRLERGGPARRVVG